MRVDSAEFNLLLDVEQVENLLVSIVGIMPHQALLVIDATGSILARAGSIDIPDEVVNHLQYPDEKDMAATQTSNKSYSEVRTPINFQDRQAGYVVGISFDSGQQVVEQLTSTTRLISQVLTDQINKENELNCLSTELLDKYEELTLLYDLSQELGVLFDIQMICDIALERAMEVVKAKKAYVALMDDDGEHLTVVATRNLEGFVGWKIPVGQGISGRVAAMGKQVVLNARAPKSSEPSKNWLLFEAILSVPLILPTEQSSEGDQVLGVITMAGKRPGEMFTAGDAKLATTIMTQVAVAIHNSRLVQVLQEAGRARQQMEIAARIQQSLLPKHPPQLPGIALAGQCLPAANVGGDYYDFLTDDDGRLILLVADASGHSVGSALMMAMARSILRYEISLGKALDKVLANTNTAMLNDLIEAEMFITLFCARYDPSTRELTFVNGGHNPPLLQRATGGKTIELNSEGTILGLLDDVTYEEQSTTLDSGDILVLYTDGVVEARNPAGELFGEEKLQNLLSKHHSLSPDELKDKIYKAICQHTKDTEQQDDITLLILKVLAS
jgi:sigma-B regulation protein RsbU (phosphoserine phosphatase)